MIKRIGFLTALLSAGLIFGVVPAAADHRDHDRRQHVKIEKRRIQKLAHHLERASHRLHRDAKRATRKPNKSERKALASLRWLDREADAFHALVDRPGVSLRRMEREFRHLQDAYASAKRRSKAVRTHRTKHYVKDVRRLMVRIDHELDRNRRIVRHHRDRYDRHARHDRRDRHDRYDRHAWDYRRAHRHARR